MKVIDLNRIREALPEEAIVVLKKKDSIPYLEIFVYPFLSDEDFEMCKNRQREIIGKQNIMEFYTEETGHHWFVYLQRVPMEFINIVDDDINSFTGLELVKDNEVIKNIKNV
jgi:hypothetical protein